MQMQALPGGLSPGDAHSAALDSLYNEKNVHSEGLDGLGGRGHVHTDDLDGLTTRAMCIPLVFKKKVQCALCRPRTRLF